jgi:hypothetical protein
MGDPITTIRARLQLLRTEHESTESEIAALQQEKAAIQQAKK